MRTPKHRCVNRRRFHFSDVMKAKKNKEVLEAELQNYQRRLDDIEAVKIKIKEVNKNLLQVRHGAFLDPFFQNRHVPNSSKEKKEKKPPSKAKLSALDAFKHVTYTPQANALVKACLYVNTVFLM